MRAFFKGPIAETMKETLFILLLSSGAGYGISWGLDWYYWERDMVGFGSLTMYLQQATEAWVLGCTTGVILAVAFSYAFLRAHRIRGD